ncbi:uncharacterized protein RhoGAP54D isoform X1 [Procambarus clarkii]|uniref:uncharacterized protein RhoGAP54D isoform X1 n=1 Tax=Procambarus clarkii TaxID=6728 RepID=UPI001E67371F|nr:uncharacterized protein LOC123767072 isoform X1 [Procambarus clarkii]
MNTSQKENEDGEKSIQQQLWHLRHEDPTQYHTLVKMHLSFATDLPTDQCDGKGSEPSSGWWWQLAPLIKKLGRATVLSKGVMEGAPLTQEGVCQAFQLIHYLSRDYNITQEGLFRKSGSLSRQQELKAQLNAGGDLNLDYGTYSAHDCASVLKSFLADLPQPLLTEGHYSIHCTIAEMLQSHMDDDKKEHAHARQIKALRLLFLLLPPQNYQLLHDLLILLYRVTLHQKENLMSAINLGTMFAPHILCPRKMAPNDLQYLSGTLSTAVAFMIEQAPLLFQVPLELEYDVRQYWSNKKTMRYQLSKRSMMDAPAKTIFTFIDRDLTAQANDKDVTEIALAELYAYVQSLPESAKKRKLIKQFNCGTGLGTPQANQSFIKKQEARGKRLGDSIKKHLFHKTVKSSKSKSQPFASSDSTKVKRSNSQDLLSSPSARSPELRMYRRNTELGTRSRLKAKSLDDLSCSDDLSSDTTSSPYSSSFIHTIFHTKCHFRQNGKHPFPISLPSLGINACLGSSSSDQGSCTDPLSPLPLLSFSPDSSCDTLEALTEVNSSQSVLSTRTEKFPQSAFNFASTALEEVKENALPWDSMLASTPAGSQLQVHSPISQAMIRASIPQKVIMTPRSRCPIIINSASNLSQVAEESLHLHASRSVNKEESDDASNVDMHCSPVIGNPTAQLTSPPKSVQSPADSTNLNLISSDHDKNDTDDDLERETSEKKSQSTSHDCKKEERESKLSSRWGSTSLRRTLSSASSTSSLFGGFFRHLSTSSLAQLATRLTSSSTRQHPEMDENTDIENGSMSEDDDVMNESLTSVFKEYLLSRSILTDNPVDLSLHLEDEETKEAEMEKGTFLLDKNTDEHNEAYQFCDSAYGDSQPPSKCVSRQCSKASLRSLDSAVGLSDSLLYCLNGNDPLSASGSVGRNSCNSSRTRILEENSEPLAQNSFLQDRAENKNLLELHSCSPDSRCQSLLKTKQGTPVPQRDKELSESANSAKVLFETSF